MGKCSHQMCPLFTLWCSSHNSLSPSFQLAFLDFTSFPSVSLSALLALSTASRMRKPPRSVCARRTTPGPRQTHHLPPAHVRLAEMVSLCKASRHRVCPAAQSRAAAGGCPRLSPRQPVGAVPGHTCPVCTRVLLRRGGGEGLFLRRGACRLSPQSDDCGQACRLPSKYRAQSFSQYRSQILIKWPLVNWIGPQLYSSDGCCRAACAAMRSAPALPESERGWAVSDRRLCPGALAAEPGEPPGPAGHFSCAA